MDAQWGVTENNRRARYYRISAAGRAHLRAQTARWLQYSRTLTGILARPLGQRESTAMIRPGIKRLFRLALRRPEDAGRDVDEEIRTHIRPRTRRRMPPGGLGVAQRS